MAFTFSATENHRYESGKLFLGLDPHTFHEIGISTERHAITIAGAGSGKGAALIIPNLLRWPHNVLAVDPKGENAEQTWQAREAMGQTVGVVDPFHVAEVPDRLRVSVNFLAAIDASSRTVRADIEVLADGLVKRHDPKHAEWDDAKTQILAGVIAYVCAAAPPEHRTMAAMRKVLLQGKDELYADAQRMLDLDNFGGLAKQAGSMIMTALETDKGVEKDALSGAKRCTAWIDDPAFAEVLGPSTFDMTALKNGRASLYLVLPPDYLATKGEFLRLFVRAGLNVMSKSVGTKTRCLFLLDEFFSLGRLDVIAVAAGLMRGYGVQLWPFLQDLGQLVTLYGAQGAQTFFGNSDAHIFSGSTDPETLNHISGRAGAISPHEVPVYKPRDIMLPPVDLGDIGMRHFRDEVASDNHAESTHRSITGQFIGKPRLPADEVRALIAKKDGDAVARSMIVFAKGSDVFNLRLSPYFTTPPTPRPYAVRSIEPATYAAPTVGNGAAVPQQANAALGSAFWDCFFSVLCGVGVPAMFVGGFGRPESMFWIGIFLIWFGLGLFASIKTGENLYRQAKQLRAV